ncbi:hypothetical protein HELRODRAFT_189252 [Helobdella robusta]|uniref:S-adenosyl-L-methionine-dependent tRNA 4-demethylwyosine synthase TYW1 n=1 Tax=Helobdella robusta TaxID=6412 RepID=T1FQV4_HELRO|nr:hypothetical protein HELRODRAFT_189252 [Helobdella robusta]ESN96458.1 hypothetical protein HELRODRAFT_189252 [Helobdella robusta]
MIEKLFETIGLSGLFYFVAGLLLGYVFFYRSTPNKQQDNDDRSHSKHSSNKNKKSQCNRFKILKIYFATQSGKSEKLAKKLSDAAKERGLDVRLISLSNYDPDGKIQKNLSKDTLCIFIAPTHTWGQPPEDSRWFFQYVHDASGDFRVSKKLLSNMSYAVVSLGNSEYAEHFCTVGKELDKDLLHLGARRVLKNFIIDDHLHNGDKRFDIWMNSLWSLIAINAASKNLHHGDNKVMYGDCGVVNNNGDGNDVISNNNHVCCNSSAGDHACYRKIRSEIKDEEKYNEKGHGDNSGEIRNNHNGVIDNHNVDDDKDYNIIDGDEDYYDEDDDDEDEQADDGDDNVLDVEDLAGVIDAAATGKAKRSVGPIDMITPVIRHSLEKQGYKLIGGHSGVKLCRWTKSMLRGRGGCYKHTFYGIESHRCMETTPSLACANKCVFCWRHHTNPVGTEWRWKVDDPQMILDGAIENHCNLIKQFKGVPGVEVDRLLEGMTPVHCALSLVGEPIMYPHINQFVHLLHQRKISSFLVTNAQFPEAIKNLIPVTQLYVSIDAGTKEQLKKIDRPLFKDYWERYISCLSELKNKKQRTVYRLTLVKGYNTSDIEEYARLVQYGCPEFIEVKGVTYCGDSKSSHGMTMKNVPWLEEVVDFVQKLVSLLPDYEIASEHAHSLCLLVGHKKFKRDDRWHTWIDYEKFHELNASFQQDASKTFTSMDYMAPTPTWACYGAPERGFDPAHVRFRRKNKDAV